MPFFNTTQFPIWVKFYADSEFDVKKMFKIILGKKSRFFGVFMGNF